MLIFCLERLRRRIPVAADAEVGCEDDERRVVEGHVNASGSHEDMQTDAEQKEIPLAAQLTIRIDARVQADEEIRFAALLFDLQVLQPDGLYQSQQRFGLYRWHIVDPVRFETDLRVTIQDLGWRLDGS